MQHRCEFPRCGKMANKFDKFFGKFHCEEHAFDVIAWPKEKITKHGAKPCIKRSSSRKFGKRYF